MIAKELQIHINKVWNAFKEEGSLTTLEVIEQLTCLLYIKLLDDLLIKRIAGLQAASKEQAGGLSMEDKERLFAAFEQRQIRWSTLKDTDAESRYQLFTKGKGAYDYLNEYSTDNVFSKYMKGAVFHIPTASLLSDAVALVSDIAEQNSQAKGESYEYLLSKLGEDESCKKFYTPRPVIQMMVEMMHPTFADAIGDPCAGTAGFLIAANDFRNERHEKVILKENSEHYILHTLMGFEADPKILRIGAMNMILHGIEDPDLKEINAISGASKAFAGQATLILAHPPFGDSITEIEPDLLQSTQSKKTEWLFMALISKRLKNEGRAAVLMSQSILSDNSVSGERMREHLIENHKLEAVITLPDRSAVNAYAEKTCILIFTKTAVGSTGKVWFYDMQYDTADERAEVVKHWEARRENSSRHISGGGLFVEKEAIIQHNYDLNSRRYKEIGAIKKPQKTSDNLLQERHHSENEIFVNKHTEDEPVVVAPAKKKIAKPSVLWGLVIILCAIGGYFLISGKPLFGNRTQVAKAVMPPLTAHPSDSEQNEVNQNVLIEPADASRKRKKAGVIEKTQPKKDSAQLTPYKKINDSISRSATLKQADDTLNDRLAMPHIYGRYKVIGTAYFHDSPNESSQRKAFLVSWNNAILKALDDKNGFVYIIFTNEDGQTSKGWIKKTDLIKVSD